MPIVPKRKKNQSVTQDIHFVSFTLTSDWSSELSSRALRKLTSVSGLFTFVLIASRDVRMRCNPKKAFGSVCFCRTKQTGTEYSLVIGRNRNCVISKPFWNSPAAYSAVVWREMKVVLYKLSTIALKLPVSSLCHLGTHEHVFQIQNKKGSHQDLWRNVLVRCEKSQRASCSTGTGGKGGPRGSGHCKDKFKNSSTLRRQKCIHGCASRNPQPRLNQTCQLWGKDLFIKMLHTYIATCPQHTSRIICSCWLFSADVWGLKK